MYTLSLFKKLLNLNLKKIIEYILIVLNNIFSGTGDLLVDEHSFSGHDKDILKMLLMILNLLML